MCYLSLSLSGSLDLALWLSPFPCLALTLSRSHAFTPVTPVIGEPTINQRFTQKGLRRQIAGSAAPGSGDPNPRTAALQKGIRQRPNAGSLPAAAKKSVVAIFCPFSQFCEIGISLLSL